MAIGKYSHAKLLSLIKQQAAKTASLGDITAVYAGNGLSGGGASGDVTLAVDINGATDGTGITVSDTDFILLADADDSNNVKKVYVHQLTASNDEPAGANTQIQFNDNGAFGASANFTFDGSSLQVVGNISGSSTLQAVGATTLGSTLNVSGAALFADTITGTSFSGSSTLQAVGNTFLGANLNVTGNITNAALTNDRVLFAGTNGVIEDSNRLTFDLSTLKVIGDISGSSTLQASGDTFLGANLNVTGNITNAALTNDRVLFAGTNGVIEDSNRLTFDLSTLKVIGSISGSSTLQASGDTFLGGNLNVTGNITNAALTNDRVLIAGTNGVIEDSNRLTFDNSTLKVVGGISGSSTLEVVGGTIIGQTLHVSGTAHFADTVSFQSATYTSLSASSTLQAVGDTTLGANLNVTGNITNAALTNDRVLIAGTNGVIEDTTRLTFNGSTLAVVGQASASSNVLIGGAAVFGVGVASSGIGGSDGAPVFGIPSSGNGQFQNNLFIKDDKKIYFGDAGESHIEYREAIDDFMTISGSSQGIVLSGSTIQIDGTLEGASPLKIGGEIQFVGSEGSATAFNFGPNQEAKIFYENSERGVLVISGSHTAGTVISGSGLFVDKFVGVGVGEGNTTHAITLPDNSDNSGKMQANAYLTYSSIRYKKDVEPLEDPLGTLNKLDGVSYVWKDTGKKDYGFIAEEVGKVLPDIVEFAQDSEYANSMDYIRIISFLVEGVKAQDKKIQSLEKKLDLLIEKLDK